MSLDRSVVWQTGMSVPPRPPWDVHRRARSPAAQPIPAGRAAPTRDALVGEVLGRRRAAAWDGVQGDGRVGDVASGRAGHVAGGAVVVGLLHAPSLGG